MTHQTSITATDSLLADLMDRLERPVINAQTSAEIQSLANDVARREGVSVATVYAMACADLTA